MAVDLEAVRNMPGRTEPMSVRQALESAVGHHKAGRLREAEQIYKEILRSRPKHADALHLLGVLASQTRNPALAVELIRKAIAVNARAPTYHHSLGVALGQCGRTDMAATSLLRALELDPDYTAAQDRLVTVYREQRRTNEAAASHGQHGKLTAAFSGEPRDRSNVRSERQLVIGVGTGRSGSTTLVKLLQKQHGAVIGHERPPRLPWLPNTQRLKVHLRCFEQLLAANRLVGDVSHWWLPYLRYLFDAFPTMKVVALERDREQTIRSFEKIKGSGERAINHWCDHNGAGWRRNIWDECYPSYDIKDRFEAIGRYWDEYHETVEEWRSRNPDRIFHATIDILDSREGQDELFDFLGIGERV